ncbi:hypothetical protein LWP59_24090 [Amycolatopsis acidiphila]|uniref:Uncharacterized protein n=1 Tax=Amycolatopsis acidiphila TaxID=715473 RepID=A0A558AA60_9PSEU|nr:hypothetical protein [Amycolatopsis acidiphila]TVT21143.1 hypothetical protein FNH06_18125 [Amycolatopsis acidiphila]UIJ57232.1 hypothetical protein LWP59_24090 [Amycolatopsis acidiphila]GHG52520.1 hypothetical protein GCM10017788_00620 [Amycolatopsis acidiphila]
MAAIDRIPADDWTDQDLLTKDEAGERLDDEIIAVTGELDRLRAAGIGPLEQDEVELLTRRLDAMKTARETFRS